MPINDLSKKQRYSGKPPADLGVVRTRVEGEQPQPQVKPAYPENTSGNVGAKRALGFAEAKIDEAKTKGAKAALHGLSFMQRAGGKLRKGVLVALVGLTTLSGNFNTPSVHNPFKRVQTHSSMVDLRAGTSKRAMSDADKVIKKWEASYTSDPTRFTGVTIDMAKELVLAALLPNAPAAGDDLAAFAKKNLGNDTRGLIASLLDGGSGGSTNFKINGEARALLEAAIGRGPVVSSDGKVTIVGDQSGGPAGQGNIKLKGVPGASIEVINLSTIPTKRLHTDDTFVLGQVKADGTFAGNMEMQPGDAIRLRLKLPDGTTTTWVDFKGAGMGADTRNAEAALFRVGLVDQGNGQIAVNNINEGRPVSEPGAVMRFVNTRTNEVADVKFDENGTFAKGQTIPGKTGDTFSIRITDGVNDPQLGKEISTLTVREAGKPSVNTFDLKDPTLHHDEIDKATGKPKFSLERFTGPLFDASGAEYTDVTQGQLGDCYFPASIATIAFHKPGTFEKIIQQKVETNQDTGEEKVWYEIHFKDRSWENGKTVFKDVTVKVDGDLYLRSWGGPLYGSDDGVRSPEQMELWFSILEKGYAMWKGESYEAIGNGGQMGQVFQDILGVQTSSMGVSDKDAVWKQIKESVDKHRPIGAGTHGDDQEALYANTGVYSDHAYSILGYKTDDKGVKYVQLRNPWGESEPFPGDGKNDGIFHLKLDDFMKLYQTMYFATTDPPATAPAPSPRP